MSLSNKETVSLTYLSAKLHLTLACCLCSIWRSFSLNF